MSTILQAFALFAFGGFLSLSEMLDDVVAVENQRARQRGRAVVAVLRGATKRDSV